MRSGERAKVIDNAARFNDSGPAHAGNAPAHHLFLRRAVFLSV